MNATTLSPRSMTWRETLTDGTRFDIRPIMPADAAREQAFLSGLSEADYSYRFIGLVPNREKASAETLTHVDPRNEVTLIGLVDDDDRQLEVGVACMRVAPNGVESDCAVAVSPDWQQRGVGTLLMKRLIEIARRRGVRRMYAVDAARCGAAHAMAARLGFRPRRDPEDPMISTFELEIWPHPAF